MRHWLPPWGWWVFAALCAVIAIWGVWPDAALVIRRIRRGRAGRTATAGPVDGPGDCVCTADGDAAEGGDR